MGAVDAAMCALAALLACLSLALAGVPVQPVTISPHQKPVLTIPDGKAHVYRYSAVVSAGQNEPTPFASKLQFRGKLVQKNEDSVTPFGDALYMRLYDIEHTLYNGPNDGHAHGEYHVLEDAVKDFETPFLAVYNNYKLRGIKLREDEAIWSKNMKRSLASLMQMDFSRFAMNETMKPLTFHVTEMSVYDDCTVDYNVYSKLRGGKRFYYVRKAYEPSSCQRYVTYELKDGKSNDCKAVPEEDLVTSAEKMYEFEFVDGKLVLNKIFSYEKLSYLPYSHRSFGIQYIETNQTFEFEKVIDVSELKLPDVNFETFPLVRNVTFDESVYVPQYSYKESEFTESYQFGHNSIEQKELIAKAKQQLLMVLNYLKENQIDVKKAHPENTNVLGKLYEIMSLMNSGSLNHVYKHFNKESEKGNMTRKIFLKMVPHTSTLAAWNFTKTIINEGSVEESDALDILAKLPMYVRKPTPDFAKEMGDFLLLDESKSSRSVRNAGILCYSILLHKTFKNVKFDEVPDSLQQRLSYFNDRLNYEPTYQMKIVYMMAMRNVEVGGIYQYLAPIVRGDYEFFVTVDIEKPEKYRIAAMWAVAKSISTNKELTYELFWPILANSSESLSVRLAAYEQLVSRNPNLDMHLLMHVHALMEQERDPHVVNYHYTTLKHMSESTNPCASGTAEMMRKVLRLTKHHKPLSALMSIVKVFDYYDPKYGHGQSFKIGAEINEVSGIAQTGFFETTSTFRRKSRGTDGWYWNIDGYNLNAIMKFINNISMQEYGISLSESTYQILDKKVRDLLSQTYGHKAIDKHIHVEFWKMNKGYITNVQVYFENSLADLYRKFRDDYKPENLMDAGEKFTLNYLDISNFNHYKMIVPTDIGLPAFFISEVPYMTYVKIKPNIYPVKTIISMKLEFESKFYHQSLYEMKFYNPFADVDHSVKRHVTTDAALPIDVTVSFNMETHTIKMVLPRMPETKLSVAGVRVHSVDQVTVQNDQKEFLKTYCPTCSHAIDIVLDPIYRKHDENVYHSVDTGLEYTTAIFDCDTEHKMTFEKEELYRVFSTQRNNYNTELWPTYLMIVQHASFNFMNTPYAGTCGAMLKIAPCSQYPTSHLEMNWRFNVESKCTRCFDTKLNLRGSIDIKAASLNQTVRYWDVDLMIDGSQFKGNIELELTRKTPGEKNFKIVLGAQKNYPNFVTDAATMKHETDTSFFLAMGECDDGNCVLDDSIIKATMKGELLDEQVEQMRQIAKIPGSCFRNPLNPLDLDITKRFDWNCLYEAVRGTTLRKYTINVTYKKIPHDFLSKLIFIDDYLRYDNLPRITYKPDHTEPGNVKIYLTYSSYNNFVNITVVNPLFSYELKDVPYGSDNKEDKNNDLILDNTGFSSVFLLDFYKGDIRPCIAHANDVITDLNQTVPMDFKDWTLMYGESSLMSLAVFAKTVDGNKMAVRIYSSQHILEVQPGESQPIITIDGGDFDGDESLAFIKEIYFRTSMVNQLYLIETKRYSNIKVYYTPYNVIVMPHIIMDRNLDGVCGHMGSTMHKQQVPLVLAST